MASHVLRSVLAASLAASLPSPSEAQVREAVPIAEGVGGFAGPTNHGRFGAAVACLGDLDADGVVDLAVGAPFEEPASGTWPKGSVWILFLRRDGTVRAQQRIGPGVGGFTGSLDDMDLFGFSLAALGDVDGDGVVDLAAGAPGDDDGGWNRGAVWILFLRPDGTVKAHTKLSATSGGFTGNQTSFDGNGAGFGVAAMGDLDGNGAPDLAIGMPSLYEDSFFPGDPQHTGGLGQGSVSLVRLYRDGTVASQSTIQSGQDGFVIHTEWWVGFGASIARLGDLDGDGIEELGVGGPRDSFGGGIGLPTGSAHVLFLTEHLTFRENREIDGYEGGIDFCYQDLMGTSVAALDDLDGNGSPELAVGAPETQCDDRSGRIQLFALLRDGTYRYIHEIVLDHPFLTEGDEFGRSIAPIGDLDGDGIGDLAVGAPGHGPYQLPFGTEGSLWILFLERYHPAEVVPRNGSGVNPPILDPLTPPLLQSDFVVEFDLASVGGLAGVTCFSTGGPLHPPLVLHGPISGELLGRPPFLPPVVSLGGTQNHAIPGDLLLLGRTFSLLGVAVTPTDFLLTNALDVTLGTF